MQNTQNNQNKLYTLPGVTITERFLEEIKDFNLEERLESIRDLNILMDEIIQRSNNIETFESGLVLVLKFQRMLTELETNN